MDGCELCYGVGLPHARRPHEGRYAVLGERVSDAYGLVELLLDGCLQASRVRGLAVLEELQAPGHRLFHELLVDAVTRELRFYRAEKLGEGRPVPRDHRPAEVLY